MANRRGPRQTTQVDPQHPQDHADDAADRDRAFSGGRQPARRDQAVQREARRAGGGPPSAAAAWAGSEHPLLKENDANKTGAGGDHQHPGPSRRLQLERPACGDRAPETKRRRATRWMSHGGQEGDQLLPPLDGARWSSRSPRRRRSPLDQVEPIANALMESFIKGEISAAYVSYMKFVSTGTQRPVVIQLLPLARKAAESPEGQGSPRQRPGRSFSRRRRSCSTACCLCPSASSCSGLHRRRGLRAGRPDGRDEGGHRRGRRHDQVLDPRIQPRPPDRDHHGAARHRRRRQRVGLT